MRVYSSYQTSENREFGRLKKNVLQSLSQRSPKQVVLVGVNRSLSPKHELESKHRFRLTTPYATQRSEISTCDLLMTSPTPR